MHVGICTYTGTSIPRTYGTETLIVPHGGNPKLDVETLKCLAVTVPASKCSRRVGRDQVSDAEHGFKHFHLFLVPCVCRRDMAVVAFRSVREITNKQAFDQDRMFSRHTAPNVHLLASAAQPSPEEKSVSFVVPAPPSICTATTVVLRGHLLSNSALS